MALSFAGGPFFDDFDPTKGFLKILFRPGYAVQARELTQTQDILQNQISGLGSYIFKSGSPVLGGQITLDTNVTYANTQLLYNNQTVNLTQFSNTIITDVATQTVRASVIAVAPQLTGSVEPPTLMIKYLTGTTFPDGANVTTESANTGNIGPFVLLANTSSQGVGSVVSIQQGIYFIDMNNISPSTNANLTSVLTNAYFVNVPKQTIILDKYNNTPTYQVGLQISDVIVTEQTDASLLDPALGARSYQAPGAARYIIDATLSNRQFTSQDFSSFVQLLTVANGKIQTITTDPVLGPIMTTLAKRTKDQSGSFTVKPFRLSLLDTANNDIANSNTQLYYAMVGPGNAYVDGFQYHTQSKTFLNAPKAQTIANVSQYSIQTYFGNYVLVDTVNGEFNFSTLPLVDLHCVNSSNVVVTSITGYANTLIGTARLRSFEYNSAANTANGLTYVFRAGLFNINTSPIILYANGNAPSSTTVTFYNGASPVNNAYIGMSLNVPSTGDTRLISSYVGATRTAAVSSPFSVLPANNAQISIIGNIPSIESVGLNTNSTFITANSNINIGSKNQSNTYQYVSLADTSFTPLLFRFPNSTIAQGLQSPTYQYRAKIASNQTLAGGTPLVVNLSISGDASATFASGAESGSDLLTLSDFLVVTNPGGTAGTIIPMVTSLGRSIATTSTTATFTMNALDGTFNNVDIFASVKSTIGAKTKTLISANTTAAVSAGGVSVGPATIYAISGQINYATPSTSNLNSVGVPQDLYISDGINIVSIIDSGFLGTPVSTAMVVAATTGVTMPGLSTIITNNYTFSNGQTDSIYDHSTLTLNPGAPLPKGQVLVLLNYYSPSTTGGYFSVDSYPNYSTIPIYQSVNQATTYSLRDCIDYRPIRDAATTSYTFANSGTILLPEPTPATGFSVSFGYYLARIDQLVLTSSGNFAIIQGSASVSPQPATLPKKSMLIYTLTLPPFTFFANNIIITQQNNQRYTMSDIGKLEKRIQTLEYYSSLNQVEQAATNQNITDSNGVTVPQLGLLVDAFTGSSVAAVSLPDYAASIDGHNQVLRPSFTLNNAGMIFDPSTSSNYQLNGKTITLPYTLTTFISQNSASRLENLNPFNITVWNGNLTLIPSSDNWISTTTLPAITTNLSGDNDAYQSGQSTSVILGTVWNNWQTIYTGVSSASSTVLSNYQSTFLGPDAQTADGYVGETTATATTTTTTTTSQTQLQTGIQTVLSLDQLTSYVGTNLVSTSVIPYMRSYPVKWFARGMKPLIQVYLFFDNVNVTNFTAVADTLSFTTNVAFSQTFQNLEVITDTDAGTNGGIGQNTATIIFSKANKAYLANSTGLIAPGKTFVGSISGASGTVASYSHRTGVTGYNSGNIYKSLPFVNNLTPSANANSICLQASAANIDGYYNGNTISIIWPPVFAGVTSTITAYNGASRIATVSPNWVIPTLPFGTMVTYSIGPFSTDTNGDATGVLWIPDSATMSFQTGTATVMLSDSNIGNINLTTTKAITPFISQGTLDVTQQEYVTTEVPTLTTQAVSQTQIVTNQQTSQTVATDLIGYYDPLAQTFLVDNNIYPNGVFITSVRVCFYSIDNVLPVTLQIRPTENGYPSSGTIIPGSTVTLLPSQCHTTKSPNLDGPNNYTEFFFTDPIHLLPGNEFAIVLISNSNNYNLYTAAVGDLQLGSNKIISQPPYLGVLFKSQNSSTWTPSQGESLMFRLTKAVFSKSSGFVTFKNKGALSNTVTSESSTEFYMDTMYVTNNDQTSNNTSISYSFRGTSNTGRTLDSSFNVFVPNQNYTFANRYVLTPTYGSFLIQSQMTSVSQDISPIIDTTRYSVIGIGNIINNGSIGNTNISITNAGNTYNIANTNIVTLSANNGSGTTLQIGSLNANGNISSIIVPTNGGGSLYSSSANISIIASGYTPGINATAIFNGETSTSGGNFLARYITRAVTLSPGVEAGNLQVWLDAYLPPGTTIFVYYKILSPHDTTPFANRPWVLMNVAGTQKVATTFNSFTTYQYVGALNQYGNPVNSISYGSFNTFNQFAIKIAMASSTPTSVPMVKKLRCFTLPASA